MFKLQRNLVLYFKLRKYRNNGNILLWFYLNFSAVSNRCTVDFYLVFLVYLKRMSCVMLK